MRLFFYFGHEIPEVGGTGYDASYRDRSFTLQELVDGLERITCDSTKFDLVVLSTCFNGTPHTISELSPFARYIIASPGNLHRSYFDLRPFEELDLGLRDGDMSAFAKECAHQSFDRLTKDIQTEITVAVYDVDRVQGFVHSVDSVYDHALTALEEAAPTSIEHCDCAEDPAYVRPAMSEGIDVFYRPARFGRSTRKQGHSGWECLKLLK
ncbi:MAG: clostripain-related cysteine peptidase [candidate division Zixibacteria bacterium]|nr:clostripain-related cysteine peptidase [candidate division Zixibacteria bacterium]